MSLTISQPVRTEFNRVAHEFSPRISLAKSRVSPKLRVDSPLSSLRVGVSTENKMATPHRGLPPPAAMTLPDPSRQHPSYYQPLGPLSAPSAHGREQDDAMQISNNNVRAEEAKRSQEEERTKQETLRLDQRRIEYSILRDALQGGVPPVGIPLIYAGMGASGIAGQDLHHYFASLQTMSQQLRQLSPTEDRRGEPRLLGQSSAQYGAPQPQQHQVLASQPVEQSQQPGALQTTFSAYQQVPTRPPPTSAPRSATHTQLPRLTTNEMYVQQPTQQGPGSAHPLQQSQTLQDQPGSSPSIHFVPWYPPGAEKSMQPQTPASKGEPHSAHPGSHLSESDYKESPRKRKAQGQHQPVPPPPGVPAYTSPPFSTVSSGSGRKAGHGRSRSGTESRPQSRRDPEPARSSAPEYAEPAEPRGARGSSVSLPQEESAGQSSTEAPQERREDRPPSRGPQ